MSIDSVGANSMLMENANKIPPFVRFLRKTVDLFVGGRIEAQPSHKEKEATRQPFHADVAFRIGSRSETIARQCEIESVSG